MSTTLTDPISTTDLRVWVEMEAAPEVSCQVLECDYEAVTRFFFSCGHCCELCVKHSDRVKAGPQASGGIIPDLWTCSLCVRECRSVILVTVVRWEPIR